jgi:hypothetical protein
MIAGATAARLPFHIHLFGERVEEAVDGVVRFRSLRLLAYDVPVDWQRHLDDANDRYHRQLQQEASTTAAAAATAATAAAAAAAAAATAAKAAGDAATTTTTATASAATAAAAAAATAAAAAVAAAAAADDNDDIHNIRVELKFTSTPKLKRKQKQHKRNIAVKISGLLARNNVSTINTSCATPPALQDFWRFSGKLYS